MAPRLAPRVVPRIVAGSLFLVAVVVIAAVAAWPIYRSGSFLLLVVVAPVVAAGTAALAWLHRWRAWRVAAVLAGAVLVLGVPLAVPARLGSLPDALRGLGEVVTGLIFAWKDLVTVDLPVGSYRNLLVPALVVFLVGTCVGLLCAWREDRIAYAAAPAGLGMISFGLFFGRTSVSSPVQVGPVTFYAPLETALGVAGLVATLLWLAWRSRDERVRALRRAAGSSGVRVSRRPSRADQRRTALGAGMVAVAVVAAAAIVPLTARGAEREVLRSATGPAVDIASAVSPLAEYRMLFADDRATDVLFTVTSDAALPDRVRLATLDSYDGELYRSGGDGGIDDARFVRVPSVLDAGTGRSVDATVTVGDFDEIWMPTIGRLQSIDFTGERAPALADGFYYRASAGAGVQTAGGGLERGDRYRVRAVEPDASDLADITAPGGAGDGPDAPASLSTWVDEHVIGSDGPALAGLVALLRERGYLSHGLSRDDEPSEWENALPDYVFQPSAAGHSLARIDTMFDRLLERETDPRAETSGNYVAAVGDDEQFAVAVALIAAELGFPSRVVVGAVLSSADAAVRTCDDGICRAQDISAWTEVQSADGEWVPIDVTPQYVRSPSLEVAEQRDPLNVTEVRPDTVEEVVPPEPLQQDSTDDEREEEAAGLDLAWLWPVLRVTGTVLLVLAIVLGPLATIAAAKALRRRARRQQQDPAARIAGGWDEYVDAAVDAGGDATRALTRTELAALYSTPVGHALAVAADRAAFSDAAVGGEDADAFWRSVEDERRSILRSRGFWRGLAATVSLRSFVRNLAPPGAGSRLAERGRRRAVQPAR